MLAIAVSAHAQNGVAPLESMRVIDARSDLTAALTCYRAGYRWMLRLSGEKVLCLRERTSASQEARDVGLVLGDGQQR